jgi:hypothetical protein
MAFGLSAGAVGLIGAGASLIGGAMSADAAGNAADTQAASADRATALQREMFDKQTELQEPFRQAGLAGQNRLLYLLGLTTPDGTTGGTNDLRAQLLPQFTSQSPQGSMSDAMLAIDGTDADLANYGGSTGRERYWNPTTQQFLSVPIGWQGGQSTVDEAGLQAAMQAQQGGGAQAGNPNDPAFGSLMRDFGMSDFEADPGYDFRMSEGLKGLERSAAARGGLMSGRAMKDTMRFGQGLGAQEYGNAFNRFQINRTNKLNPLMALSGIGQTATNQVANAAGNFGRGAGETIQGAGTARASGYVGQANAWNSALGTGVNNWTQNRLLNPSSGYSNPVAPWSADTGWMP